MMEEKIRLNNSKLSGKKNNLTIEQIYYILKIIGIIFGVFLVCALFYTDYALTQNKIQQLESRQNELQNHIKQCPTKTELGPTLNNMNKELEKHGIVCEELKKSINEINISVAKILTKLEERGDN